MPGTGADTLQLWSPLILPIALCGCTVILKKAGQREAVEFQDWDALLTLQDGSEISLRE